MNIFLLDLDVYKNSEYHVDRHVVKMILEYAQLLSTAHRVLDGEKKVIKSNNRNKTIYQLDDLHDTVYYSATHINHPCAIWVRESHRNYKYLVRLLSALCEEYTFRYGKTHKVQSSGLLDELRIIPKNIPRSLMTEFKLAMPDHYKVDDPIESYRNYYRGDKISLHSWKNRNIPEWLV